MYRYKKIKKYDNKTDNVNYSNVLIGSVFTEKFTKLETDHMIVAFWVKKEATRNCIKAAVEKIFKTTVLYVNIQNLVGKNKRSRMNKKGTEYNTGERKRAIVRLGSTPDVSEVK